MRGAMKIVVCFLLLLNVASVCGEPCHGGEGPSCKKKQGTGGPAAPSGSLLIKIKNLNFLGPALAKVAGLNNPDEEVFELDECKSKQDRAADNTLLIHSGGVGYSPPQHVNIEVFKRDDCEDENPILVFAVDGYQLTEDLPEENSTLEVNIDFSEGNLE